MSGYYANSVFFNKKAKIRRPELNLNQKLTPTLTSNNILFSPYPPPPQSGPHLCITHIQ